MDQKVKAESPLNTIAGLTLRPAEDLVAWVEFKDGFKLHLRYVSRVKLLSISKACEYLKYDPQTHSRLKEVDQDKFLIKFFTAAVIGWEGLNARIVESLIPVDTSKMTPEELVREIPFKVEFLAAIARECFGLDNFIQQTAMDNKVFRPDSEEIAKN